MMNEISNNDTSPLVVDMPTPSATVKPPKLLQKQQQIRHGNTNCCTITTTANNIVDGNDDIVHDSRAPSLSPPSNSQLADHVNGAAELPVPLPLENNVVVDHSSPSCLNKCSLATTCMTTTCTTCTTTNSMLCDNANYSATDAFNLSQLKRRPSSRHESKSASSAAGAGAGVKRFIKFDVATLSSAPAPDVKIGQRVAYKEYYGNEFGTIRWIGEFDLFIPQPPGAK